MLIHPVTSGCGSCVIPSRCLFVCGRNNHCDRWRLWHGGPILSLGFIAPGILLPDSFVVEHWASSGRGEKSWRSPASAGERIRRMGGGRLVREVSLMGENDEQQDRGFPRINGWKTRGSILGEIQRSCRWSSPQE